MLGRSVAFGAKMHGPTDTLLQVDSSQSDQARLWTQSALPDDPAGDSESLALDLALARPVRRTGMLPVHLYRVGDR